MDNVLFINCSLPCTVGVCNTFFLKTFCYYKSVGAICNSDSKNYIANEMSSQANLTYVTHTIIVLGPQFIPHTQSRVELPLAENI